MSTNQPTQQPRKSWFLRNLLFVGLSVVPLLLVSRWALYRLDHTVSSDAVIKGNVAVVGARIDGRLAKVAVQANQFLRAGDVIAQLEDDYLSAALSEARIEKDRAEQQLEMERVALKQQQRELEIQLSQAEAELKVAEANHESTRRAASTARRDHQRVRELELPTAVSESQKDAIFLKLQQAEVAITASEGTVQSKRLARDAASAKLAGIAVRQQQMAVFERDILLAQARIDRVQTDLEATLIRSPIDGWVGSRIAGAGTSVRIGDPIVTVLEDGPLWLEAWVEESSLEQLAVGSQVDVRLKAHPKARVTGMIEAIGVLSNHEQARQADGIATQPQFSNKVSVRISLQEEGLRLMPGLTAVVGIQSSAEQLPPILAKIRLAVLPVKSWLQAM